MAIPKSLAMWTSKEKLIPCTQCELFSLFKRLFQFTGFSVKLFINKFHRQKLDVKQINQVLIDNLVYQKFIL